MLADGRSLTCYPEDGSVRWVQLQNAQRLILGPLLEAEIQFEIHRGDVLVAVAGEYRSARLSPGCRRAACVPGASVRSVSSSWGLPRPGHPYSSAFSPSHHTCRAGQVRGIRAIASPSRYSTRQRAFTLPAPGQHSARAASAASPSIHNDTAIATCSSCKTQRRGGQRVSRRLGFCEVMVPHRNWRLYDRSLKNRRC